MRARMAAAFAFGFACGALLLAVALWRSGSLVAAAPPVKNIEAPLVANLPAPTSGSTGDLMKDLRSKTPPPLSPPADEPFDFSQSASAASPGAPAGRPLIGPRAPTVTGESDRIVPDRTPLPHLSMPLSGIDPHKIVDTFHDARGTRKHDALDIMAPRGTPVRAVTQGNVAKLFTSKLGGITVYQFDDSRTYCYYYAHLDRYAKGLQDGTLLRAGDVLGYVGSTGDASAKSPHLHFAVFKLGPEKKWWEGTPIDPLPLLH